MHNLCWLRWSWRTGQCGHVATWQRLGNAGMLSHHKDRKMWACCHITKTGKCGHVVTSQGLDMLSHLKDWTCCHVTSIGHAVTSQWLPWVAAQAVRWPSVPKVARSHLSQCSKSCDLQPALNCAICGAQGVLPCVRWGVRPVNWIYRLWRHCS